MPTPINNSIGMPLPALPPRAKAPTNRPSSPHSLQPEMRTAANHCVEIPLAASRPLMKATNRRPASPQSPEPEIRASIKLSVDMPLAAQPPLVKPPTPGPPSLQPVSPRGFHTAAAAATPLSHRRIGITVDYSRNSSYAINWAVANFLRPSDSTILMHAGFADATAATRERGEDLDTFDASQAEGDSKPPARKVHEGLDAFSCLVKPLEDAGISYTIQSLKSDGIKESICHVAHMLNLSTVILGSNAFGEAGGAFKGRLGSVAEYCVYHCPCTVAVLHSMEGAEEVMHPLHDVVTVHPEYVGSTCFQMGAHNAGEQDAKGYVFEVKDKPLITFSRRKKSSIFYVKSKTLITFSRRKRSTVSAAGHSNQVAFEVNTANKLMPKSAISDSLSEVTETEQNILELRKDEKSLDKICLVYDERMLNHKPPDDGVERPEIPERLSAIHKQLKLDGWLNRCHVYEAEMAHKEDLVAFHEEAHVDKILSIPEEVVSLDNKKLKVKVKQAMNIFSDTDLYHSPGTRSAILLAAGGVVKVCSLVARRIHRTAFALVRPPGHHASKDRAAGFCYINNIAVGAQYLIKKHSLERVLIVDWDVHHGDGTQNIFYQDKRVLVFSLHRSGKEFYPQLSERSECFIGEGGAEGYNANICWPRKSVRDDDFFYVWKEMLLPVAREFSPEAILISSGFDAAMGDKVGECCVTPTGYATLLSKLNDLSIELKIGLIMVLEGGYDLGSIGINVSACLKVLSGDTSDIKDIGSGKPRKTTLTTVAKAKKFLGPYWSSLRAS